jgi:phage protein D
MAATPERRQAIPDYRITIGGEDITPKVRPRLVSLRISEKRGGEADQLDLVLDDADGKLALPKKGALIRVRLGWAQGADVRPGLVDKGSFKVDEVEWGGEPDKITIRGRSADLTDKFRVRQERSWRDTTLGAIVREIAGANGLEPKIDAKLAAITISVLAQHNESDMALLRRLGRQHDAVATVKDGKLIFSPIGKGATASGRALPGLTIKRSDGSGPSYRELDRGGSAGVEARWHDQGTGTRKTVKAGGGTGKPRRLRRVFHSEADARAAANAANGRTKRGAAEFGFTLAYGRADIYPERAVTLSGFKPEADAKTWLIAELTHELDKQGYRNTLKLETKG